MVLPLLRSMSAARATATSSTSSFRSRSIVSSFSTLTSKSHGTGMTTTATPSTNTNQTGHMNSSRMMHSSSFSNVGRSSEFMQSSSTHYQHYRLRLYVLDNRRRHFSTPPPVPTPTPPTPPPSLTDEMAVGIQDATQMYVKFGVGKRRLEELAKEAGEGEGTLVARWQRMMETFLTTQLHVLAGLGYAPNEQGLALYNTHLSQLLAKSDPSTQEKLRESGRDTWREVLCTAFAMDIEEVKANELSIVEARNVMHKVSQRMQEPDILEYVAQRCASTTTAGSSTTPEEMAFKHSVVQDVLVNKVYLGPTSPGSSTTLVSECGFGEGERGYVLLQCAMAEHQADPLCAQYIGAAMMRLLQSAGMDMQSMSANSSS
mmetsp:Transcript_8755/g.12740  ORF Transcript_8755/g.12740 Transcript_8755/m.12740 type:complete len:373 (-) Transcript_8755:284-1402(-)